jgi:hypothetical protein
MFNKLSSLLSPKKLYRTFADFFLNWDFFSRGFSLYISNVAGRFSNVRGARSAQFCVLRSLKRRESAVCGRTRAAKTD